MRYQININTERIGLEKKWLNEKPASIPENGVSNLPIGKEWYRYLVHYWFDIKAEPEKLFEFGKLEVEKVKAKIETIKRKSGLSDVAFEKHINDDSFYYNNPQEIQSTFEKKKKDVENLLPVYFPFIRATTLSSKLSLGCCL